MIHSSRVPDAPFVSLSEIAHVRGGYASPAPPPSLASGDEVRFLQASDLATDGTVIWKDVGRARVEGDMTRYVVREGDIVLSLRSARLTASVARHVPGTVVASGQWALITPDASRLDADFLVWYLNHPTTASRLSRLTQGTKLQFLSLASLRNFPIAVPSIALQRRIARVMSLHTHTVALEQQLADTRARLISALTMDALLRTANPTSAEDA
jgi:hypothetical protein